MTTGEGDREALADLVCICREASGHLVRCYVKADAVLAAGFRRAGSGEARLTEAARSVMRQMNLRCPLSKVTCREIHPDRLCWACTLNAALDLADRAAGENDLRARIEALIEDAKRTTYTPHTVYADDLLRALAERAVRKS